MRIPLRTIVFFFAAAGVLAIVALAVLFPGTKTEADTGLVPITGWAWSDTIGWISLNGSNYGLFVASDGALSGDAWSENIGWVSASSTAVSGCPQTPCAPKLSGGALLGWFKALAGGTAQSGGWDGFISLSGSGYGVTLGSNGDFNPCNETTHSCAWGDVNVGWVDFSRAHTEFQADVCPNLSGIQTSVPQGYGLENGQCIACSYTCPTETSVLNSCTHTTTQCSLGTYCSAGSSICPPYQPPESAVDGYLKAIPRIVNVGGTSTLSWSILRVQPQTCSVAGNGNSWIGESSGSHTSNPINQRIVYTLSCRGLDNSPFTQTTTIIVAPEWREK